MTQPLSKRDGFLKMSEIKQENWLKANRFTTLLIGLAILIFSIPIANLVRTTAPPVLPRLLFLICFTILLLSALFTIGRSRRRLIIATVLSIPGLVLLGADTIFENDTIKGWAYIFTILFLGYVIVLAIQAFFQKRAVTKDTICASLCVYLLIGVCWAFIYSIIAIFLPDSFNLADSHLEALQNPNIKVSQSGLAMYYSFVTLSTLGYGDITPANGISRVFSYAEAVTGQIYLAVLVARLVGLNIAKALERKK